MQGQSSGVPPNSFDRFEEYKAILPIHALAQSRRQTATNLFVSLNVVFMGALGYLLLLSHLTSWWAVAAVGALAVAVVPVNLTWYRTMKRYEVVHISNYTYLQEIEEELRQSQAAQRAGLPEQLGIGFHLRQGKVSYVQQYGLPSLERQVAVYFLLFYPVITLVAALLTYLIVSHRLPPLTLG